jgi:glycosyltransferase involved in cell wall biosynthesis
MLCHQRTVEVLPGERVNIVWVGTIDERKSLDLLLAALSCVKSTNWHLYVIGRGPLADNCIRTAADLGVADNVTWVGAIPREAVSQYYRKAHLHAITSMMEANTTVLFEAMSFGIPTITLDHCGMRDTVCDKCGVKVPLASRDETIKAYASKLELLISNPKLITELSNGVIECSRKVTWDQRKLDWETFYNKATENWRARQRPGRS